MADAAAARREARRKRILENSHNRLQLISGKTSDECSPGSLIRPILPDQDYEIPVSSVSNNHSRTCLNNGVIITERETFDLLSTFNHDHVTAASGDGEVVSEIPSISSLAAEPVQTSLLEKTCSYKYDIVLLSLLLQAFYTFFSITNSSYFFLPVIIYSVTKMIWFPSKSNSNIANVLMLLNTMSTSRVQYLIQIAQYGGAISRDICIFLFTTIFTQSLYMLFRDGLIT